jgi:hypothetical protein
MFSRLELERFAIRERAQPESLMPKASAKYSQVAPKDVVAWVGLPESVLER